MNKRILSAFTAACVTVTALGALTSAAAFNGISPEAGKTAIAESYNFYLHGQYGGNGFWGDEYTVSVTEDGTYTITTDVAGETNEEDMLLFLDSDVNVFDFSEDGGNGVEQGNIKITVDSVKVDGEEVAYTPSENAVTTNDDGSSLRVNLVNRYASPVVQDIDPNITVEESISVTFTIKGIFGDVNAGEDPGTDPGTEPGETEGFNFFLHGQYGGNGFWNDEVAVNVTADGTYTLTANYAGETNEEDMLLFLDSDVNVFSFSEDGGNGIEQGNIKISIDSVKIDGEEVAYTPSETAVTTNDDGSSLRVNIVNRYADPVVQDIDPNVAISENLEVTFTIEGFFGSASSLGDVNFDGKVDASDASETLSEYARLSTGKEAQFNADQMAVGDIDKNGAIDASDASAILSYYAYLSTGGTLSFEERLAGEAV